VVIPIMPHQSSAAWGTADASLRRIDISTVESWLGAAEEK
jgi:hypothetical protein